MDFPVKIDALELLIDILKDHEGELNNIVEKLAELIPDGRTYHFPATVKRWGNSKGVYIHKTIWEMADLDVGDKIEVTIRKRTPSMR